MARHEESALKTCISENLGERLALREALCCCSSEILDPTPVSLHIWVAPCKPSCPCPWLFSHHLTILLSILICDLFMLIRLSLAMQAQAGHQFPGQWMIFMDKPWLHLT